METTNNWQSWQPEDKDLDILLQPGFTHHMQPNHPLMKLKKNLLVNTIWGILITIGYIVIMIMTPIWPVLVALGITTAFNVLIIVQAIQLYRSIKTSISSTDSVLSILKKHYQEISAWCTMQNKLAIWVYPFAAVGGYVYGGVLSSGKSFEELFSSPLFFWALAVMLIILIPISLYAAKYMTRKAFGVHLETLKATIQNLEA